MYLNVEKLNEKAILPTRGSEKAAGWDLYANIDEPIVIQPGEMVKISSGIAIELPGNTFGGIFPRSGLSTKNGLSGTIYMILIFQENFLNWRLNFLL